MSHGVTIVLTAALVALVCTGGSTASPGATLGIAPRLEVVANRGVVGVGYIQSASEQAPIRIVVRVPDGFRFTPDAHGAAIGSVVGSDVFVTGADPRQPLTGVLTIADPATFAAAAETCTGTSSHDAVWAASVPRPTAATLVPIFVDRRTFTICPDATQLGGTPIAIALQLGIVSNSGIDRPLVSAPSTPGRFIWSATVTRPTLPNAEPRSILDLPQQAAFRAKVIHGRVRISGRVVADGKGIANVRVRAVVSGRRRGFTIHGHTRADGRFTLLHPIGRGTFLRTRQLLP